MTQIHDIRKSNSYFVIHWSIGFAILMLKSKNHANMASAYFKAFGAVFALTLVRICVIIVRIVMIF